MGLKRVLVLFVALVVVTGLVLGLISGVFGSLARQGLEATGLETPRAPSTIASGALDPSAEAAGSPGPSTGPASPDPSASGASSSVALPAPVLAGTEGQGKVS